MTKAVTQIQQIQSEMDNITTNEIMIPTEVQKITTDFNVQIKFPDKVVENDGQAPPVSNGDRSSNPNIIRITGKKENCEGAANALVELVPITAEVSVPYEFHKYIIGQKGNGVGEMMYKFDVNITRC